MLSRADNTETETSIRTDLRAIFVSLELSRTTWLVTSLSPGTREKMSKHSVSAGDIGGLLARLRSLQERVRARQEAVTSAGRHPGGRARGVLDPSSADRERYREPRRRSSVGCHVSPAAACEDRQTRWRHTGSHLARLQTR